MGFEIGKKGTPHIQGFIYYDTMKSFKQLKEMLPKKAYIEIAKGTPKQASDYCKKDEEWYEFGELPQQGSAKFEVIQQVMENPETNFHLYNMYRRSYELYMSRKPSGPKERVLVFIPDEAKYATEEGTYVDAELESYEGEKIITMPCYTHFLILNWYSGHPQKIRRGFELTKMDPEKIYLTYSSETELNYLKKKYMSIDYICPSYQETSVQQSEDEQSEE